MENLVERFERFWESCPPLLYGLAMAFGATFALGYHTEALIGGIFLTIPPVVLVFQASKKFLLRASIAFLLFCCTAIWVFWSYQQPLLPPQGLKGSATIAIQSIEKNDHTFGSRWTYRGNLLYFQPKEANEPIKEAKNLPVVIAVPSKEGITRPPAKGTYLIQGTIKMAKNGSYQLQPSTGEPWIPLTNTWSSAEARYQLKQLVKEYVQQHYRSPQSRSFLTGIATGSFDDKLMAQEFSRFGLQHIMAISGFHFSIIAAFLSLLLGAFLPRRAAALMLMLLLTSYFLFLGPTASVMRAWIMCLIACLAAVFNRKSLALNSLGVALIAMVLYNPLQITNLGFQFSFATTAAILLLFDPADSLLKKTFLPRTLRDALKMPQADRHAYVILSAIRQGLALTIAVNATAIPMTLFYFLKFPWMGLLFNLFFPFLVSVSMLLLLLGLTASLLSPLAVIIHQANDYYTQALLNFTTYTPKAFDAYLRTDTCPSWVPLLIIGAAFTLGIYWKQGLEEKQQAQQDWAYI